MADSSSTWLHVALQAKRGARIEGDTITTLICGYAGIPSCQTFMKNHDILRPENENVAQDIDANPGAVALTHVVRLQCKEKVSVKDIGQKNKQSLEKRLRLIWQGREAMPMKRTVKCTSCSLPKTPVQDLNEHCQKRGYQLDMSLKMVVGAPEFATQSTCQWALGESEGAAKQTLARSVLRQVREEEKNARARKKRHADDFGGQLRSVSNKSCKQNPEIEESSSGADSESD